MPPAYGCTRRRCCGGGARQRRCLFRSAHDPATGATLSILGKTCEGAWSDIGELANLNGLLTGVDTREDHSATNS